MAVITSAWSTTQDALAALIETAVPGQKVAVGTPYPDQLTASGVFVWLPLVDAEQSHAQQYEVTSLTAKTETWVQEAVILATVATTDGRVARDRVDAVLHPLLAAISSDPRIGGLVQLAQVVAVRREEAAPDRTVRQHAATVRIAFSVWLQAQP